MTGQYHLMEREVLELELGHLLACASERGWELIPILV